MFSGMTADEMGGAAAGPKGLGRGVSCDNQGRMSGQTEIIVAAEIQQLALFPTVINDDARTLRRRQRTPMTIKTVGLFLRKDFSKIKRPTVFIVIGVRWRRRRVRASSLMTVGKSASC